MVRHEELAEPFFVEAVTHSLPEFNMPITTIRVAEPHHGPYGHLPHTEGLEYRYISFASPIVVTGGVPTRAPLIDF